MARPDYDTAALRTLETHVMFLITTVKFHDLAAHRLMIWAIFKINTL